VGIPTFMVMGEERRLDLVIRTLAASILLCLGFCGRLWLSTRTYPLVPLGGIVPAFPFPLDHVVLALLVGLLAGLVVVPRSQPFAIGALGLFILLFAQDQSRLWPSFYLFALLLGLVAARRGAGGEPAAAATLAGMRFAVAMSYAWGGIQKLTPEFYEREFFWFLEPLTRLLPVAVPRLAAFGIAAAVFEAALGLGLLSRRFRRAALVEALLMHAVILVCIGPLRGHWNDAAWIWSQTMAVLVWLLFAGAPPFRWATMFDVPAARRVVPATIVVLLGCLPALNNLNLWDSALSFNIYTGNVSAARVVLPPGAADGLPAGILAHATVQDGCTVLDLDVWSMHEFNALAYPEPRIFRAVFADLCRRLPDCGARLVIVHKAGWFMPRSMTVLDCAYRELVPRSDDTRGDEPRAGVARPEPVGRMVPGP